MLGGLRQKVGFASSSSLRFRSIASAFRKFSGAPKEMTVRDALNSAIGEEMSADPRVLLMGEEVGQYQGACKAGFCTYVDTLACGASLAPLLSSSSNSSILNKVKCRFEFWETFSSEANTQTQTESFIAFVLGGPGSGKGTQCEKIVETFGFKHLSAGDLLRREIASKSEYGSTILNIIKEGRIVPSQVTVSLIHKELESSGCKKFLIDGFPRSEENRIAFEKMVGTEPNVVLFFDCPEKEMVKRVLSRNQGRVDDNIETMRKRLKTFEALHHPVINHYSEKGKLFKISAVGTVDEIFEQVRPIFASCQVNN